MHRFDGALTRIEHRLAVAERSADVHRHDVHSRQVGPSGGGGVDGCDRFGGHACGSNRQGEPDRQLAKQATWAERPVSLAHYRNRDQREVDVLIERGRQVAAIEVKATATPRPSDARHLVFLRDRLGDRFTLGVVLHAGAQPIVLGDRLVAAPVSALRS